jgi:hypothetical protein
MATSGIAKWFKQHALHSVQSITTYLITSGMSCFVARVHRTNLEIMSRLESNTFGGITTYIQCSAMPTPRQPTMNSGSTMFPTIEHFSTYSLYGELPSQA